MRGSVFSKRMRVRTPWSVKNRHLNIPQNAQKYVLCELPRSKAAWHHILKTIHRIVFAAGLPDEMVEPSGIEPLTS